MAASPDELSDRDARDLVIRAVGAMVLFVLCAGVALVLTRANGDGGGSDDQDTVRSDQPAVEGTGPLPGTDVASYIARRRAALPRSDGLTVAVVSFTSYRREAEARRSLDAVQVDALLVAPSSGGPSVVAGDLGRWAAEQRADAESERANLEQMLRDTTDPDFMAQFKADVRRLTALLATLDPTGPIVFGAVVEGSPAALAGLTGPSVRLVDAVGRHLPADLSSLHGLRPEETVKAGQPATRPA